MWEFFWKYETDIPPGTGIVLFSGMHLAWTLTAVILIIITAFLYRRQSETVRRKMEIIIGVLLAAGYVFRWIWVIYIGHYNPAEMLPLHLCGLSAIFEILAVFTKRPLFKEFGYACGLPGAIVTFIMPGIGNYPLWNFYYLLFIMDHAILILLPLIWIWGDGFRPSVKRLLRCFVILLIMAGFDFIINKALDSNFMFINYVPSDTPLKAAADWFGNPGYQFAMGGILIIVWSLLYIPWIIIKRRSKEHAK